MTYSKDKIGILAGSLNEMSIKLQENIKERKKAVDELKRETTYLSLMQTIATIANEASTFEHAAKECIDKVCEITGWPMGHLYLSSDIEEKKLISTKVWHIEDEVKYKEFKIITEDTDFNSGIGLPGRVLETGQPAWILDVNKDTNFPRNKLAASFGIKSGFAFPIIIKNEVGAVMEFFSLKEIERDEYILKMSYYLGVQLGHSLERQRSQDALQASAAQIRSIVTNAYDAFILINDKGIIIDWNPQSETTFGWQREEVLGRSLAEVIIPIQYRQAHEAGMKHFNKTGEGPVLNKRLELSALHRNGHEFPIEFTISLIMTDKLHVFAAFLRDISERKQAEENLKQAKERAEASEKVKELFLANMSHEIRTPMNAIVGFARILENTELTPEQKESVGAISQSGDNLMVIINDILDFSKIEAGKITLEKTNIDIAGMISSTISMMKPKYDPKNLKVEYVIDPRIPPVIIGDKVRLTQILINLISNAIKFTLKGEVRILVNYVEEDASSTTIQFDIKDSGIGIEKDKLDSIFDSFTQARFDTTRKYGGTGLGLSIVKKLVELQNGTINIKSEINKGSSFSFTLPFLKADILPDKEEKKESIKIDTDKNLYSGKIKVLLAEDNPINQLLALRVINNWGFEVDIAENGLIAIDKLKNMDYDMVLMDLQMPEMDGYEATSYIRKHLGDKKNIPIVAMTAHAIKGEIEKCLAVGMNDYISKPFKPEELYARIIHFYEKNK